MEALLPRSALPVRQQQIAIAKARQRVQQRVLRLMLGLRAQGYDCVVLANDGTPDVADVKLYVDGVLETTGGVDAQAINTAGTQDVSIGVYALTSIRFFEGLIDDVRIYNTALSGTQIRQLFE